MNGAALWLDCALRVQARLVVDGHRSGAEDVVVVVRHHTGLVVVQLVLAANPDEVFDSEIAAQLGAGHTVGKAPSFGLFQFLHEELGRYSS